MSKEDNSVTDQDPPEVDFHHGGYLFLAPENRAEFLMECVNMQRYSLAKVHRDKYKILLGYLVNVNIK